MLRNILLLILIMLLLVLELTMGSVSLPLQDVLDVLRGSRADGMEYMIVFGSRLPRGLTALLAGCGLSVSGLLMQTLFRNPLAGPSVMGISSGASLGVALLVLATGGIHAGFAGYTSIALAAMTGAFAVLLVVLAVSRRLADNTSLLIFGIMLSFLTSAIVDALQFKSSNESLRSFINWGMGSFAETGYQEILMITAITSACIVLVFFLLPRLNLLLLGDDYAQSLGVNIRATRLLMIIATGLLTGVVTAFCGPVAFVGLAVPHIVRMWLHTSDHRKILMPVILSGSAFALICDLSSRLLILPLNTIASALGAPVVLWIILRGNKTKSLI